MDNFFLLPMCIENDENKNKKKTSFARFHGTSDKRSMLKRVSEINP